MLNYISLGSVIRYMGTWVHKVLEASRAANEVSALDNSSVDEFP